jgi:polyphosphate kinase 2 (PPK2 family)
VGTIIRDEINKHLDRVDNNISNGDASTAVPAEVLPDAETQQELQTTTVLDVMDMSLSLPKKEYKQQLQSYQARLNQLHRNALKKKMSTILVFEGPDAAGKGGAIRRVTAALDARHFQVFPIAAPTDEERAHHYLWRFWRHLSRAGKITIFDRSWYGRVLVERIEGFAEEDEWRRAYSEINSFEEMLTDSGILLMKYWIHVTKD